MVFTDAQIGAWVAAWLWPLFRIASFFMVIPVIGTQLVPMRVRVGLAFVVTLLVAPLLPPVPEIEPLSFTAMYVTLQQIFIGTLMGLMFVFLMQLFVAAGQMIAMQMGLGFASMIDPSNGVNVPILSQIFLVCVTLIFLSMNGHLVMIEVAVQSFQAWPISDQIIGPNSVSRGDLWGFLMRINWLFASALVIALPAITAVLIINLSFGIMTRAAPQMNVFSLGFPIGMLFGLFIVWVSISGLLPQFDNFSTDTFLFLRDMQGF
ncbi:flagellar biosynthetic protein FliR [Oleiphilus sp. HI0125]|uniref:flagellar biosynthetic protein FliR n=2 Tax=Oleiphilus sp. HI0125 TaxID=1822266 RepID=UPI0007C2A236|nr:flagellar biosynthetic protein FliR [Oleiphilus sp. HI0125]KZZ59075.1 flagellar biosynthetic protein FliR [Oleiphilus sp. HI0125]